MSYFRPTRVSSPPKPPARPSSRVSEFTDDSHAPGIIAPELIGLSAEEISFIDEVIGRAPATASTFLTVFKAYNDVLQERGLDPQNEVVYYGKLLKIGTLKGKNWADKWNMVKERQGYVLKAGVSTGGRTTRVSRTTPTPARPAARLPTQIPSAPREPDTSTFHSQLDVTEKTEDERDVRPAHRRRNPDSNVYSDTPRPHARFGSPATLASNNSLGLDTGPPSAILNTTDALRRLAARARNVAASRWDAETTAETTTQVSSIPPSYGAAVRDEPIPWKDKGKEKEKETPSSALKRLTALREPSPPPRSAQVPVEPPLVPQQRARRGSTVDAEDAFRKIKEQHDEETADRFRNDRLVERCYEVWKQGYEWIVTTGEQIADARDSLILRRSLQHWQRRAATRRELHLRVAALSNRRLAKRFFQVWKLKLKERKQVQWREDMRARMKAVRERGELRLKKDMWAKWRQSYLSHLSEQQFARKVVIRFFNRWKTKLKRLDELEAAGDHCVYVREEKILDRHWDTWRHATELRRAEKTMRARVDLRIVANAVDVWRQYHHQYHVAEQFYDILVLKHALRRWQAAQKRIRMLETRAVKHVARRNDVIVRAIMHIWKAHERGQLLTRVRDLRLLKQAWSVWKRRMEEQKEREEMAQLFRTRSSSIQGAAMLKRWCSVYQSHQNAQSFAVHYHRAQLQYKMLLTWRLQLRAKLRMVKQARIAQKHLVLRRCFRAWTSKLEEQRRSRKLKAFELRVVKRSFEEWRERAMQQRGIKLAEQIVRERIALRVMTNTLRHWTTRVADMKFTELDVNQKYEKTLVVLAYKKWKALCKRHVDELRLMESYQDVKREENKRKMFYRWLAAAKKTRHRRLQLQAKEEEFKLTVVAGAWDKWRERYQDIRLQPLADAFIKQHRNDLLFRAFAIWKSKSLSPDAVKFHAKSLKVKCWNKWRELMPRALQAKAAREMDCRNVLRKAFALWKKAQQTKIEHKAINYARYLELLSSAPRQPPQSARTSVLTSRARNVFPPKRITRPATPTEDEAEEVHPASSASRAAHSRPTGDPTRLGIASLLKTKPRTSSPERKPRSPERPKFSSRRTVPRDPSPSETEPEQPPPPPPPYGRGGIAAWRKDIRAPPPKSAPPSVAGDVGPSRGRSSLWEELREVRRRPRAPTERTYSPEPL